MYLHTRIEIETRRDEFRINVTNSKQEHYLTLNDKDKETFLNFVAIFATKIIIRENKRKIKHLKESNASLQLQMNEEGLDIDNKSVLDDSDLFDRLD